MRITPLLITAFLMTTSASAAPFVEGAADGPLDPALSQAPPLPFTAREDGGYDHAASLGQCPASIAGFRFREESVFKEDGSDVGCQYDGENGSSHMTVYFYQTDRVDSAAASAQEAGEAIVNRFPEAEFLPDESESCGMMIDLMHGLRLAGQADEDTTITVGQTPCFIFQLDIGTALVTTDMIGPWHLKVRITETGDTPDINRLKMQASDILNFERGALTGEPSASLEEFLRDRPEMAPTGEDP